MNSQDLCEALIDASTEEVAIECLREFGYWDNRSCWRYYGDYENNYNTIGNQQSHPEAALVEKLVNSVDARLMNECLAKGISPTSADAPQSIREAVALFFDEVSDRDRTAAGQIRNWSDTKRLDVARGITFVATGLTPREGNPCFSVADCGEGQTPDMFPLTFCSLTKSNKLRIPFVQGKFNMGGTGVFKFCGQHGMQLILSRRNPTIVTKASGHGDDDKWGFTIVRREDPEGGVKSSVYTYLAPIGATECPGQGGVLRFAADTMPIFPDGRDPYALQAAWGTLVKLYEYGATGFRSNIIRSGGGFLMRMDLLLPSVALPIRLHECRQEYKGHKGSFQTTLTGVGTRLEDDKQSNLEEGFPSSCPLSASGQQMTATIYAFKKGKDENYRKSEGIIFTLNGQTHGHIKTDFFRRKKVGLSYLKDSVLVMVDCSKFSGRAREDLFMNSRDRISSGDLRAELEKALEEMLRQHEGLRALKEKRRREDTEAKLSDSKPLEDVLESLLRSSPALANLFLPGTRVTNPFKTKKVRESQKAFVGKRHPTYFKFKGLEYGSPLHRETCINMRSRITFETDAVNDYFGRSTDPGEFELYLVNEDSKFPVQGFVGPNLQNGVGTLSVQLPINCQVGDVLTFQAVTKDPIAVDDFVNIFHVCVKPEQKARGGRGTNSDRKIRNGNNNGEDVEQPGGIALPNIIEVSEEDWGKYKFDKHTALRIKDAGTAQSDDISSTSDDKTVYDFYVNTDNIHLLAALKPAGSDVEMTRARFLYGLVLVGLALLQQDASKRKDRANSAEGQEEDGPNIEDHVSDVTAAVAPVLLPMIEALAELSIDDDDPMLISDGADEAA